MPRKYDEVRKRDIFADSIWLYCGTGDFVAYAVLRIISMSSDAIIILDNRIVIITFATFGADTGTSKLNFGRLGRFKLKRKGRGLG